MKKRLVLKLAGLTLVLLLAFLLWGVATLAKIARDLPSPDQLLNREVSQSTKIYDKTGGVLLYEIHGDEKRSVITFDEIPDYVKKATIAIEDQGFYEHPAFDWRAILRAGFFNILRGRVSEGGSTITQQLAKNSFLTPERTITRKLKELILASWIEKRYSKDEILGLYLNQISYGANNYGLEAASEAYFNKPAKDLSLAETALLSALPKAPTYYSPWGSHLDELLQRKNYILEQMYKLGYIDQEQKGQAQNATLNFANPSLGSIKAPHFVLLVKDYLTQKYGEDAVERGGLKITTTLDFNLQQLAEKAVSDGAKRNSELYEGRNAALVAEDPKTGQILALVGSKDYFAAPEPKGCIPGQNCQFEGNFNVASQGLRQPGSALKPFAYLAAFKKGYSPATVVFDLPTEFSTYRDQCPLTNIDYSDDNPLCFHPQNFDQNFRGPVTLRDGLAQSINVPSVKTLYLAGLENAIKTASDFGITTLNDPSRFGLSLVLGGGEVMLLDMVSAYSVLAADGIKHKQSFLLKVEDSNGNILEIHQDEANQIFEGQSVRMINDILSDSEARAGLFQNSLNLTVFPDRQVSLKTGTTNDYRDAWAMGYTPYLTVGVWAGNNNNQPMQRRGGSILAAVPIWHDFMAGALSSFLIETFIKPDETALSEKPMLNGQYLDGNNIHSILFYVNRGDPSGAPPDNPREDPQFLNWESPVEIWRTTTKP